MHTGDCDTFLPPILEHNSVSIKESWLGWNVTHHVGRHPSQTCSAHDLCLSEPEDAVYNHVECKE